MNGWMNGWSNWLIKTSGFLKKVYFIARPLNRCIWIGHTSQGDPEFQCKIDWMDEWMDELIDYKKSVSSNLLKNNYLITFWQVSESGTPLTDVQNIITFWRVSEWKVLDFVDVEDSHLSINPFIHPFSQ